MIRLPLFALLLPPVFVTLLLAVFVTLLLAAPLSAQSSAGMLPPDIADDFTFHRPAKKKLVGRIGFTATIGKYERIFSLDLESGSFYPIVTGPGNNRYPTWSPDGKKLLFTSDRTGKPEIHLADWNGARVVQVTSTPNTVGHPTWRPDSKGNEIVFYLDGENGSNLYAGDPYTNDFRLVTEFDGRNITPRVSPDGTRLAYTTDRFWPGWDVCIFDRALGSESCPLRGKESFCRPAWHPDGKQLLYAFGAGKDIDIGLLNLTDLTYRTVTSLPEREYDPVWSPAGGDFIFVSESEKRNLFQIFIKMDGDRDPIKLVSSPYSIRYLTWDAKSTLKLEAFRIRQLEQQRREEEQQRLEALANPTPTRSPEFEEKAEETPDLENSPSLKPPVPLNASETIE